MDTTLKFLGARIRAARERADLSQAEVARLLDVAKQTVSQWELGRSPPLITNLVRFSAIVGVSPSDLLAGIDSELPTEDLVFQRVHASSSIVPVLPEVGGGRVIMKAEPLPENVDYVAVMGRPSRRAIGIKITGTVNVPRFLVGDVAVIEPEISPDPGQFVLAYCRGEIVLRRYIPAAHGTHVGATLKPENPNWPSLTMDEGDQVLGTLVETISMRRD